MKGNSLWCDTTVAHILRNEMYTGTLIQGKKKMLSYKVHKLVDVPKEDWIVVENNHEAIIDKETFEKVQDIINRDTRIKMMVQVRFQYLQDILGVQIVKEP